jgi:hypothetical protein
MPFPKKKFTIPRTWPSGVGPKVDQITSRRPALHLHPLAAEPVAQRAHHQRDRTATRGVQAQDQNADLLPSADTAAMLFWAWLVSGQINMRRVDGWKTISTKPIDQQFDLSA